MKHKKLIISLILFLIVIALIVINALFIAPHKLTIREETIKIESSDETFKDFTIAYFSDLHYGTYTLSSDLDKVVETINSVKPDLVLFGGDLVDNLSTKGLNKNDEDILIDKLKSLKASISKYAVLGEHDEASSEAKEKVLEILSQADFVVLENENIKLSNGGDDYINLVGLDCSVNGYVDVSKAYEGISNEKFTLAFFHCPDTFNDINTYSTDYALAGHSHGGQIYFPLINLFNRPSGCIDYYRGKHHQNNATLDISNGVGLENKSIRLFADAEVVFYKIKLK